jgi:AcrR family transcriptional regulator
VQLLNGAGQMNAPRRMGAADSTTRRRLLDIAERVMVEEGYAAVTSRRIAQLAEVTSPLVHYYFRSMDDLFIELLARIAEENLARQEKALASPRPLSALWAFTSNPAGAAATAEFATLALHRPQVGAEIARHAVRFRAQQIDILRNMAARGALKVDPAEVAGIVVAITSLGRIVGQEHEMGISIGHTEARRFVAQLIESIEGPPA